MNQTEIKNKLMTLPIEWQALLRDEFEKEYYQKLIDEVSQHYLEETVYPPVEEVFRAFELTSPHDVKVVILGQDPYHEEGQANGLAFSVSEGIVLPPSLVNIYKELNFEYGYPIPRHNGGLEPWAKQGVLLLNSSLTVKEGMANSHAKLGWSLFTDAVIRVLDQLNKPIVYLLWGNFALKKAQVLMPNRNNVVSCPHPSPLSASRGFFHSDCFKEVNRLLLEQEQTPIDWQIKDF